ncbi:MAG: TetR/AcrR family transcriptional regulator [Gordonia sp. (in: high G+C Gram-positive bacteria)]
MNTGPEDEKPDRAHTEGTAAPTPPISLRDSARTRRRAAIVDSALRLFQQLGYDNVTVADICAAAEVSPRTFFRYFTTKDDLLAEASDEMYRHLVDSIADAPADLNDHEVMVHALLSVGKHVIANPDRLLTFVRVAHSSTAGHRIAFARFFVIEHDLAQRIASRSGTHTPPAGDWRTRVVVGRALVGYRVWLDTMMNYDPPDPYAYLREILSY